MKIKVQIELKNQKINSINGQIAEKNDDLSAIGQNSALRVLNAYQNAKISKKKNVAIVLNKFDKFMNPDEIYRYTPAEDSVTDCVLHMKKIQEQENEIRNYALDGDKNDPTKKFLSAIASKIDKYFGKNTRLFATSLIIETGTTFTVNAKKCEVPLLWLLSKSGVFASTKKD